ncbi:hypothetical protein [Pedobacter panaciterrae]
MKTTYILLFVIFALTSCGTTPKVLKYYKRAEANPQELKTLPEIKKLLNINAFVLDPLASSNKTITDLAPEGQQALIEALSTRTKTTKELYSALALPIKETPSINGNRGSLTWKKRIVLNITKASREPADRVQQILFDMDIPANLKGKVEFISWDKIATETQSVDLGKILAGRSTTLSFSPELTMAGMIQGTAAGSASNTTSFNEEKAFTAKKTGLNAALINPNKLQVYRELLPNENPTGNIVVEVTLKSKLAKEVEVLEFDGIHDGTSFVKDPAKISILKSTIIIPDLGNQTEVPIDLTYQFRYRKVGEGANTEPEYDDVISYIDGEFKEDKKFLLLDKTETDPKFWEIRSGVSPLNILKPIGGSIPQNIQFDSFSKADGFLNWLKQTTNISVSGQNLYLGTALLKTNDLTSLKLSLSQ